MYKAAFILIASSISFVASSQYLANGRNGELIREMHYTNYKGSPYLFADWVPSTVKIGNQEFQSVYFNVDLHANKVLYKSNDSVFSFKDAINEFTVMQNNEPVLYKRGNLLNAQLTPAFVEVLSLSPLVVKHVKINVAEESSYGTGTKELKFLPVKEYYVQDGNGVRRIKLSKDEAKQVFGEKWDTIEKMASANNISYKSEEGWRWMGRTAATAK